MSRQQFGDQLRSDSADAPDQGRPFAAGPRTLLLWLAATLVAGCAGRGPKPMEIPLMPAPAVYEAGAIDPFDHCNRITEDPGVLFATDRAPAGPEDRRYDYFTHRRANMLHLGAARTRLRHEPALSGDEARWATLRGSRSSDFSVVFEDLETFGVLEKTIRFSDMETARSEAPGQRFFEAIDHRLDASGTPHVYIYVHGYKIDIEESIVVAAELSHFLGHNGAVVAYSWPTKVSTFAYFGDLDNARYSARYLRTLILDIARNTNVEKIHVIGYSAGTQLVSRMLADLGMYGFLMSDDEIDEGVKLGNVILTGSDVDSDILSGYVLDGALRVPDNLTIYVSEIDTALRAAGFLFAGRVRAGRFARTDPLNAREEQFLAEHPNLQIIDVTRAEGSAVAKGHRYFRTSPWVSSDIAMQLLYDLPPEQRGLVKGDVVRFWQFPADYVEQLPGIADAIDAPDRRCQRP
ncbi:MAG: alpha/beta hydrolase [Pseudomonadota bacterium]